jgi:hypothetical protein
MDPEAAARVVRSYHLGDVVDVQRDSLRNGTAWHSTETMFVSGLHPACWLEDSLTVPFARGQPEQALRALTDRALMDRALQPENHWRFADFVAVENILIGPYGWVLHDSGLLQYRRLLIVEKASNAHDVSEDTPLATAWVLAHRDMLAQDPFASGSYMLAKPYWDLYEKFKDAPWADELAWKAAQLRPPTDECYSNCVLSVVIIDGPMQYWIRLPHGHAITAALNAAIDAAKYAADLACFDRKDTPVSRSDSPVPAAVLDSIRTSLAEVTAIEKRQLLEYLRQAEAKCR